MQRPIGYVSSSSGGNVFGYVSGTTTATPVAPIYPTNFESIATINVGSGGSSSETFVSIPSTYKHLQLRWISRSNGGNYNPIIRFNGDSGNNYSWHYLDGNGASVTSGGAASTSSILIAGIGNTANTFSVGIMDILDYTDTNKFKTVKILQGVDYNGSGAADLWSGNWQSTSAITSMYLGFFSTQYSQFALYGIKG
jgi:hypothetical protein